MIFRQYDCRKTPEDGLLKSKITKEEKSEEANQNKSSSAQRKFHLSKLSNWCRNCDRKHDEISCPLTKPEVVVTDSIIDFSAKAGTSGDKGGSDKNENSWVFERSSSKLGIFISGILLVLHLRDLFRILFWKAWIFPSLLPSWVFPLFWVFRYCKVT